MGLTFNFPDEEVENQNSSIDTRQLEGDDLSEEEKLALCMRTGLLEEDAKTFLAPFIEDKGSFQRREGQEGEKGQPSAYTSTA